MFIGNIHHLLENHKKRGEALYQEWCSRGTAALKCRDAADLFQRTRTGRSGQQFHKIAQFNGSTGKKVPHLSGCITHPSSAAGMEHYPDCSKETIGWMLLGSN